MSARKQKKMSMKEVKAPDEFQASMAKTIEFMQQYGAWVLAGLGVVVVAIVGGILMSRHQDSVQLDLSTTFDGAFAVVAANTSLVPATDQGGEQDAEAKAKAAEESKKALAKAAGSLAGFAADNEGEPLARLAQLARGAAATGAGDHAAAAEAYRTFLEADPESSLSFIAWEALGLAADREGRRDEAVTAFTKMSEARSSLSRANAFLYLGDLFNPAAAIREAEAADSVKAKSYYESGLKEADGDPSLMPPAMLITRRTLEQRIAALP